MLFAPQMFGHLADRDRPTEVARKKRPKLGFYVSGGKRPHLRPAAASYSGVQMLCGGAYGVTVQHVLYYFALALGHLLSPTPLLLSFLTTKKEREGK